MTHSGSPAISACGPRPTRRANSTGSRVKGRQAVRHRHLALFAGLALLLVALSSAAPLHKSIRTHKSLSGDQPPPSSPRWINPTTHCRPARSLAWAAVAFAASSISPLAFSPDGKQLGLGRQSSCAPLADKHRQGTAQLARERCRPGHRFFAGNDGKACWLLAWPRRGINCSSIPVRAGDARPVRPTRAC